MTTLTITRPDDWHVHLRDGDVLKDTVKDISRYNGSALHLPNTTPTLHKPPNAHQPITPKKGTKPLYSCPALMHSSEFR